MFLPIALSLCHFKNRFHRDFAKMCWIFADAWLEDADKEAADQVKAQDMWEYIPARPRKKKKKKHRYVVVQPGDGQVVQEIQNQRSERVWQYVPAALPEKESGKKSSRKKSGSKEVEVLKGDGNGDGKVAGQDKTVNMWEYIPAGVETKASKKSSRKRSSKKPDIVVSPFLPLSFDFQAELHLPLLLHCTESSTSLAK